VLNGGSEPGETGTVISSGLDWIVNGPDEGSEDGAADVSRDLVRKLQR
jgi:hypothetical protein